MYPPNRQDAGGKKELARFDLQVSNGIRVCELRLIEVPSGDRLVYSPSASGGCRVMTFSREMLTEVIALASDFFDNQFRKALSQHGRTNT